MPRELVIILFPMVATDAWIKLKPVFSVGIYVILNLYNHSPSHSRTHVYVMYADINYFIRTDELKH